MGIFQRSWADLISYSFKAMDPINVFRSSYLIGIYLFFFFFCEKSWGVWYIAWAWKRKLGRFDIISFYMMNPNGTAIIFFGCLVFFLFLVISDIFWIGPKFCTKIIFLFFWKDITYFWYDFYEVSGKESSHFKFKSCSRGREAERKRPPPPPPKAAHLFLRNFVQTACQ